LKLFVQKYLQVVVENCLKLSMKDVAEVYLVGYSP